MNRRQPVRIWRPVVFFFVVGRFTFMSVFAMPSDFTPTPSVDCTEMPNLNERLLARRADARAPASISPLSGSEIENSWQKKLCGEWATQMAQFEPVARAENLFFSEIERRKCQSNGVIFPDQATDALISMMRTAHSPPGAFKVEQCQGDDFARFLAHREAVSSSGRIRATDRLSTMIVGGQQQTVNTITLILDGGAPLMISPLQFNRIHAAATQMEERARASESRARAEHMAREMPSAFAEERQAAQRRLMDWEATLKNTATARGAARFRQK